MTTRRRFLAGLSGAAALMSGGFAPPAGLRLGHSKRALWDNRTGPHLRGAVFVQRRVYRELDGPDFLGPGPVGAPVTDAALDLLAETGANLASWSGPGPFMETAPFNRDPEIEDHIGAWLDACRARGLFTVLCFRSGPGRSAFAFHPEESWYPRALYDASIWRDREKQDAWAAMTVHVLRLYGGHPALAGVLAMDEPNGADLGLPDVWPHMAARITAAVSASGHDQETPLLLSPDRWARTSHAAAMREATGPGPVMVVHDYEPWAYTHQEAGAGVSFDPRTQRLETPAPDQGPWAMLEFGAVRYAPGLETYLSDRISVLEAAGANWAAFRWTSGWTVYERQENHMSLPDHPGAMEIMRRAFAANRRRPA